VGMVFRQHAGCRFYHRRRVSSGPLRVKQNYVYFCEVSGEEWGHVTGSFSAYGPCSVFDDDDRVIALDAETARLAREQALRPFL